MEKTIQAMFYTLKKIFLILPWLILKIITLLCCQAVIITIFLNLLLPKKIVKLYIVVWILHQIDYIKVIWFWGEVNLVNTYLPVSHVKKFKDNHWYYHQYCSYLLTKYAWIRYSNNNKQQNKQSTERFCWSVTHQTYV